MASRHRHVGSELDGREVTSYHIPRGRTCWALVVDYVVVVGGVLRGIVARWGGWRQGCIILSSIHDGLGECSLVEQLRIVGETDALIQPYEFFFTETTEVSSFGLVEPMLVGCRCVRG
jgi:hypothetical protein